MRGLARQDRNGARNVSDIERKYKLQELGLTIEDVEYLKKIVVIDEDLSSTSKNPVQNKVITEALNNKVNREVGKELSSNDFTDEDKAKVHMHENKEILDVISKSLIDNWNQSSTSSHNHTNKSVLDAITQTQIEVWNKTATKEIYDLSNYKVSDLTILRSSCIKKNDRVVINFVGTIEISTDTTKTIFNLPEGIRPKEIKDFIVFGQTNNENHIGHGYITEEGLLDVSFNTEITSYVIFSVVYDLE